MSYWANTSSNNIVKTLIDQAGDEDKAKIERLFAGGTIGDNLWNFMFLTGYFRKIRKWMTETTIYAELDIPNKEVKYIFQQKIQKWFRDRLEGRDMRALHNAVLSKNYVTMQEELNDIFEETISYMDQNETYYHGMVAGLLTGIKGYVILSNREGKKGRSDLLIKPIRRSRETFVAWFKVAKNIDEMEQKADEAIRQIEDKQYDMHNLSKHLTNRHSLKPFSVHT